MPNNVHSVVAAMMLPIIGPTNAATCKLSNTIALPPDTMEKKTNVRSTSGFIKLPTEEVKKVVANKTVTAEVQFIS